MEENSSSILVVDDNPEIREIIQVLLGGEGYLVETAGNGVKALEMLENREYDLIILDIMMPGMDGYQTCRKMREESNAPILFLSARTKDSDKTLGFSSGGDDYLAKPFSYNELISRAKALIRRYQVYKGKANNYWKLSPKTVTRIAKKSSSENYQMMFYSEDESVYNYILNNAKLIFYTTKLVTKTEDIQYARIQTSADMSDFRGKIGRASCRERV